jgi:uncharacterized protein
MKKNPFVKYLISFAFLLSSAFLFSQTSDERIPERPSNEQLISIIGNKEVTRNFLSPEEINRLEKKLIEFSRTTSNQICIVIVDTLNGIDPSQFASLLGNKWGIGMEGTNNGIVLLICPASRDIFISPANRLQGAIPDMRAKQIIDNIILPAFKKNKHFEGLDESTDVLMLLAKGEINKADKRLKKKEEVWKVILLLIVIFGFSYFFYMGRSGYTLGGGAYSSRRFWGMGGGGSSWGGGFGGFGGGGGFNGGGAGGRW